MRRHLILLAFSAFVGAAAVSLPAAPASAHTGGALDPDGCHADHRTGSYHCHRGAAAGYTFPNREAMLEAVRTGKFPEKTVEAESFFSKLWPWGKHHEQQSAEEAAAEGEKAPAGTAAPADQPASAKEREIQEKLKVLQGLYEMGLITKDEYEARRKTILEQI